jgi:hypothetical protein
MHEYIKRTDAIEQINRGDLLVGNFAEWAREIIWRTPYADVKEVKHGHWMEVKFPTGIEAFGYKEMMVEAWKCSVCKKNVDVSEGHFRYCPHCGSKMDGEYWYE